eukprot:gb/GECH01004982.1/.p1 GENE.gb/GECH01004982.1/~~gb/GECH01004982.1/.p1  ORF type:complete len:156 (+),score=23.76 gb/GECH01004982.1/:1-468(+)
MEHQNSKTNAQLTANYSKKNNFYTENLRHKIRNEILSHDRTSPSKTPRRSRTTRFNWDEYEKKKEHTEMREVTNSKEQKNASTKNSPTTTKSTALDTSTELLNQARNRRKNSPKKFSQNNSAIGVNIRPTTREIQVRINGEIKQLEDYFKSKEIY